ncbi:MAG: ParB/RepB/Spo0J family partition protein [Candidatus Bathyarchaeia archaeon]
MPKVGDRIPVERFHVSEMNVRADELFGDAEEDKQLIAQLRRGRIVEPFKARPEGNGYGVVVGRRRFLAKKEAGAKYFVVGTDCLIEEMSDEEAQEASLIENLEILRKSMNPITRAEQLNEIISFSSGGLRGTARRLGISASTLSEWLKVLELTPKMQEAVAKGLLYYTDALMIARMKLGEALQDELAEVLETKGLEALKKELMKVTAGKMKRGIPTGVYRIDRVIWDKRNRTEMGYYEILMKAAEKKGMKVPEYIKDFMIKHIEEIAKEIT